MNEKVNTDRVEPSFSARNISAIFDQKIFLGRHAAYMCKSSFYHLRNIAKIRYCLSKSDTEILIHALSSASSTAVTLYYMDLPNSYLITSKMYTTLQHD